MTYDSPDDGKPQTHVPRACDELSETREQTSAANNIFQLFGKNRPSLRLVRIIGASAARIIPFRRPLGLIIGGLALSIYALI